MTLKEQFNRDGYAVIKNWLKIPTGSFVSTEATLALKLSRNVQDYTNYMQLLACNVCLTDLFCGIIASTACELIDRPSMVGLPILHAMSPKLRIPRGYYGTAAHQDWPSVQGSLDMITVWIALTDADLDNFPLEVIPGSHKQGLREGKLNGSVLEVETEGEDFVSLECKAGDVVLLSGFLVHRTGTGDEFRLAISQRFNNASETTFADRGYPCAQKTVVDREIKWKPTVEQVRAVYD